MDFKDLIDLCKVQAIADILEPTENSVWHSICRSYSKKFGTPLHLCLDGTISPEDIVYAEFADQLEDFDLDKDLENILDKIYMLEDPDYEREKRIELRDFIKKAEKEEEERVEKGKPIHPGIKSENDLEPKNDFPKNGSIDLSHLEDEENPFPRLK